MAHFFINFLHYSPKKGRRSRIHMAHWLRIGVQRGLETLAAMRREKLLDMRPVEKIYPEFAEVDAKVIALARERGASIVTNDVALGRIAELQGIEVLSLNALAEALRRPLSPGEEFQVTVQKEGREPNQGVGYLDDGSMVVIEGGRSLIGAEIDAVVTSVVQTSGGRMVFAKPSGPEREHRSDELRGA